MNQNKLQISLDQMKQQNDIWVIIPAYNEGKHIIDVIKAIKSYASNIVVVDDGSKDRTAELAEKQEVNVLKHIVNMGKGAALKTGCDFACSNGAKIMVVIDADAQHDPAEIPHFIEAIKDADIVFGRRSFEKRMPLVLRFGNHTISFISKVLFGVNITDTQSGYRCFTCNAYKKIRWQANDYSMESEMIANVGKNSLKYKEIKIKTIYSDRYKGTTILDGIKIVFNMFWWKLLKR